MIMVKLRFYPSQVSSVDAYRLSNGEVPGSNPGKGENFSMKIIK